MLAAQRGHTEIVKALIEAGAKVNLQNEASYRLLMYVVAPLCYFIDIHRMMRLP